MVNACRLFLQWLKEVFLTYLKGWEEEVMAKEGYNAGQKAKMLLSRVTMDGIQMTGILINYIATLHNTLYVVRTYITT